MNTRLIIAIVTSLLDEAAIVAAIIWLLPKMGLQIPWWGTVLCVLGFAVFAVVSFRVGSRTLRQAPMLGFTDMIGTEGLTTARLKPDGMIKIESELWAARAEKGQIEAGTRVVVTAQNGLKLMVKPKV
jgi:membrane protein implicated in regulation of membrane protease activity